MNVRGVLSIGLRRVKAALSLVLGSFFGSVEWHPPGWFSFLRVRSQALGSWTRSHPRLAALRALLVLVVIGAAFGGTWWYRHRPKPVEIALHAVAPELTKLEQEKWKVFPLVVVFDGSVAPLDKVGKTVAPGPVLSPSLDGAWTWDDDHHLNFQPKTDWPIGQSFTITIPKKGFVANHIRLAEYELTFDTASFGAAVSAAEFYQDPVDPSLKKVVATVTFTHPADVAGFEKHLNIHREGEPEDESGKFTVTYDKYKLNAYIHSASIPIPPKDTSMWITLAPGIRAAAGGPPTEKKIERQVSIPGIYSFLRVNSAELSLVDNERNEPEQILVLETTTGVAEKDMQRNVSAYLLPVNHPDKNLDDGKHPYRWSASSLVGPEILNLSQPVPLDAIPYEKEYATLHSYRYRADVGRYIYVRVNKGIRSFGGYVLGQPFSTVAEVPEFPKQLKILSTGALLSMSGEKKVPLFARDVDSVRFEVGRVLPDQLQHLVSQSGGDFRNPSFDNDRFNQDNISERFTEIRDLPKLPHGQSKYFAFDFSKYLEVGGSAEGRRGVFFFTVEGWDPVRKVATEEKDRRLIVVTDLGILAKDALDGSHDLFVQSIAGGAPVAGANVQVIGSNGVAVLSAATGEDGHVAFPTLVNFKREQSPVLYLVRKGNDMSFLPFNRHDRRLDISRFEVGGVANAVSADRLSAYLFSDRGIYRPGDEIHTGIIVKPNDWSQKFAGVPVEVAVTDARGLVVMRQKISLSASGFEEVRYTTQDTSPTGTYTVNLYVVKDNQTGGLLGSTTLKVQEFLPDRMKIATHLSREVVSGWVSPDDLKGLVTLRNLFGTPAAGRRITGSMSLTPAYPAFAAYGGFSFYDPMRAKETFNEDLQETRTNDSGEATLELNLQRYAKATYRLRFVAQGFEAAGGRSVSAESSILVCPMPYLIGFKPDGDLHYVTKGAKRSVALVAIDHETKKVPVIGLTMAWVERKYVSVLTKQPNGTYKYESVKKEATLRESPLVLPAAGANYPLPTEQPGDYALLVHDNHGTELNRIEYSVAGKGNLTLSLEKNAELQLALDKADYTPGEEIEVQIKAPYAGAGLITIERERVFAYRWFKSDTTSTVQKIVLPKTFEGNGYVSVSYIRDINSDEIFMSPLSYGVAPFSVSRERRTAKIFLRSPELAKPGEDYKIHYKTDRPARIVIFAVDEGILQVARYGTPNPLGYFFQKRALEVTTSQILDLILPEFKRLMAVAAPGGDAGGALGKNLNPFKRKREKPVAFWSGIIDSGPQERELLFPLPDYFNGTLRVMAVAVSPDAAGVFQKTSQVRGDFVINPNAPAFVAPGDEFEVSVSVANNVPGSGANAQVTLEVQTSPALEVIGPRKVIVTAGEMREGTASFRMRAKALLGSAAMTFRSSMGSRSSHYSTELSVRPPVPYMTTLTAGHVKKGKEIVPVTRRMYPEFRTLQGGISDLPLGLAGGLVSYLEKVPYGCTEQVVSQAMPAIVLRDRPEFGYVPGAAEKNLASAVATLQSRQNEEGAFALWPGNAEVAELPSVYATQFLLEAKERGLTVPREVLDSAMAHLNQLAASEGHTISDLRIRAYAIYLLTRNGVVTTNYATAVQKQLEDKYAKTWKKDLAGIYLAATYQLLKQERLAGSLIGEVRLGDRQDIDDSDYYYNGAIRDAQLLYILARHFPDRLRRLGADEILTVVEPLQHGSYSTLSSAYTIMALDAYARSVGIQKNGKLSMAEISAAGASKDLALPAGLFPRVPLSDSAARIQFTSSGDFNAFFMLTEAGFDTTPPQKAITSKLEVFREYTVPGGQPLQHVHLGDEIEVHLKLRTIAGQKRAYVAVTDLLPGGFEVVVEPAQPPVSPQPEATPQKQGDESDDETDGESARADTAKWVAPIGSVRSTWPLDYADIREDRVVLYGSVGAEVKEFIYRIKATNVGTYNVPPTFGEAMYDRSVQARSLAAKITVERN
jgi:alpha-2-macroglobulin